MSALPFRGPGILFIWSHLALTTSCSRLSCRAGRQGSVSKKEDLAPGPTAGGKTEAQPLRWKPRPSSRQAGTENQALTLWKENGREPCFSVNSHLFLLKYVSCALLPTCTHTYAHVRTHSPGIISNITTLKERNHLRVEGDGKGDSEKHLYVVLSSRGDLESSISARLLHSLV